MSHEKGAYSKPDKGDSAQGRPYCKDYPTYDEENEVRWPLYELEIKTGVSINPYIISRKSWENRPFKTPFYVNVVNEGVVL